MHRSPFNDLHVFTWNLCGPSATEWDILISHINNEVIKWDAFLLQEVGTEHSQETLQLPGGHILYKAPASTGV